MSPEGCCRTIVVDEQDSAVRCDLTDASKARKIGRVPKPVHAPTGNCDKQTIIVAAVKSHLERIHPPSPAEETRWDRNAWHVLSFDAGTRPARNA